MKASTGHSRKEHKQKSGEEKRKTKAIAKLFALCANAKSGRA